MSALEAGGGGGLLLGGGAGGGQALQAATLRCDLFLRRRHLCLQLRRLRLRGLRRTTGEPLTNAPLQARTLYCASGQLVLECGHVNRFDTRQAAVQGSGKWRARLRAGDGGLQVPRQLRLLRQLLLALRLGTRSMN